jgi:eukaryotic-like serine/threonine-protein kinase
VSTPIDVGADLPSPESPGWFGTQRIGRYEVVRRLALGGMAELFLGRVVGVPGFNKLVAIKRILPHLAGDADFVAMFRREARIAASLEHPNIVNVSDLGPDGSDGRQYYIVMPYLAGKDLLAMMRELERRREVLALEHTVAIGCAIAAGLDYAHRKTDPRGRLLGIVHRDVSPSNILLTYGGEIKLLDFGIARTSTEARITQPGTRKGKTRYTSPEQIRDLPLDGRSDVFSLGIILYELSTGQKLFDADNEAAAIERILRQPIVPPTHGRPGYSPELARIVMRALAQDREQRYASAGELGADLQRFAEAHGLRSAPQALGQFVAGLFGVPTESTIDYGSVPPPPSGAYDLPVIHAGVGAAGGLGSSPAVSPLRVDEVIHVPPPRAAAPPKWSDRVAIAIILVSSVTALVFALTWFR